MIKCYFTCPSSAPYTLPPTFLHHTGSLILLKLKPTATSLPGTLQWAPFHWRSLGLESVRVPRICHWSFLLPCPAPPFGLKLYTVQMIICSCSTFLFTHKFPWNT